MNLIFTKKYLELQQLTLIYLKKNKNIILLLFQKFAKVQKENLFLNQMNQYSTNSLSK